MLSTVDTLLAWRKKIARNVDVPSAQETVQKPLARYVRAFVAMMLGAMLGLFITAWSLSGGHGFGAMRVGPWTAWPQTGGSDIDPYARAVVSRLGQAPLGRDQGLVFFAGVDSLGATLDGRCDYRIIGPLPAARFWTIGLATPSGALPLNFSGRFGFTSSEALRRDGRPLEIFVTREARPGNWLSAGDARKFIVVLRLYETVLDVDARQDPATFPQIERLECA
jgi:hypothetical protein